VASDDCVVKVWDTTVEQEVRTLRRERQGRLRCLAFSPDSRHLVAGPGTGEVVLWDLTVGKQRLLPHPGGILAVAFSPDGRFVASAGDDKTVKCHDATSGKETPLALRPGDTGPLLGLAFSAGGKLWVVDGAGQRQVHLREARTGQKLHSWALSGGPAATVAFDWQRRHLACAGAGEGVQVWDLQTGQEVLALSLPQWGVTALTFSPDGRHLALAAWSGKIQVRSVATGEPVVLLRGHPDPVHGLAYSPDGTRLVSVSHDWTVKLWDAQTGAEVLTLRKDVDYVASVAFSPDGQLLATGGSDGHIKVWSAADPREKLAPHLARQRLLAWRWRQASASQGERHWFGAIHHWDRLLAAQPRDVSSLEQRAWAHAELKQWDQAAADLGRAVAEQPDNVALWSHRAAAHLGGEEWQSYRRVCADLLTRFRRTASPVEAALVVSICVAAPDAVPDSAALEALARVAARTPEAGRFLAAALYRAGRFDDALEQFKKSSKRGWSFRAWEWLFLALIQHHRGQAVEAQNALARAIASLDAVDKQEASGPPLLGWWDRVQIQALRREAEALLRKQ
jgi:WD40 repeat protein